MNTHTPVPGDAPDGTPVGVPATDSVSEPVRWTGLMTVLGTISRAVTKLLGLLCILLFVWLVVVVTWQVVTRQILRNSAPWTTEAATYSLVVLAMTAIAYVYSERGHIAVEMFVEKLPLRVQKVWSIVLELIVVFFTVFIFIWGGARVADTAWEQQMSILPLTVGQVFIVLPIAGVLIVFYSAVHIVGVLAGVEKPLPDFDENAEAL